MNYRVIERAGWVIVRPSGAAENNEPLRVRHLLRRWLSHHGVRVIVNLMHLKSFGVWELGVLTSLQREVDQRGGILRVCELSAGVLGYFDRDRFTRHFDVYSDLESALSEDRR